MAICQAENFDMATRDWNIIKSEYVAGEISTRALARKHHVSGGKLRVHAAAEHWVREREEFRAKMAAETRARLEQESMSARIQLASLIAEGVARWKSAREVPTLRELVAGLELLATLDGETTQRAELKQDIRDWRVGLLPEEIAQIEAWASGAASSANTG